jgi:DNA transposition AAA+ family ATPase
MHNQSLPPADRVDAAAPAAQADSELRTQLREHMQLHGFSNPMIGRELGYSQAVVSQWLGGKYPGDVAAVEARVRDYLRGFQRRRLSGIETVECEVTRQVHTALEAIRRTNDVGVVLAEAGEGKSRSLDLFVDRNPTAVLFRTRSWCADKLSVEGALMDAVGRGGYDNRTRRAVWLCEKFAGSGRLLIVDDAHKLTRPALQWWFDFHDETGCPIGFVGIYELLDKLKDDAQRFSRVGLLHEVKPKQPRELLTHLVGRLAPGARNGEADELLMLCEQVAEQHGHFRAVFKQLKLAAEIKEGKPALGWVQCFQGAHGKLVREYKLN